GTAEADARHPPRGGLVGRYLLLTSKVAFCKYQVITGAQPHDDRQRSRTMTHIFVNIPTNDLEKAKSFYTGLGADINPLFTDDNGGTAPKEAQDYGVMYSRQVEDPDGNIHEFIYMEQAAAEQGPEVYMAEQGQA